MRRIAVPSDDGLTIAQHFGKCRAFVVFDTEGKQIVKVEVRSNGATACAHGGCQGHGQHTHDHVGGHAGFVALLHDCSIVLCLGMGSGAAEALRHGGVTPVMVGEPASVREALDRYLEGRLDPAAEPFCQCHG